MANPVMTIEERTMSTIILPRFERSTLVSYVLILLFSLLVCSPMLWIDRLYGSSLQLNLVWLRNFTVQLSQGELYPRWLIEMNLGTGSPVFYFYAPFPFYVAAIPGLLFP